MCNNPMESLKLLHKFQVEYILTMDKTIVYTNEIEVSCDGDTGEGPDHPLVYYTLKEYQSEGHRAACFYCGKIWILNDTLRS
jgi:uncharacterized Zn-finger protein